MTDNAKPNAMIELLITLIIPSLILMKLSDPEDLGVVNALLLALSFPLFWGMRDFLKRRKLNLFAALGLTSILLTGGIGLLQLDTQWLAIKEAAIPGLLGLGVTGLLLARLNWRSRDFNLKSQRRNIRLVNVPQGKPAVPVAVPVAGE